MRLHFPKSTSVSAGFRVASCRTPAAPRLLSFLCQQSRPRATTFRTISPSTRRRQDFGSSRVTRAAEPAGAHVEEPTPLSQDQYHHYADSYIDSLVAELEEMQEQIEEVDVEYTAGVLTLIRPPQGTYVLNKQPPNRQIWLSSPVSGPKRYDYVERGERGEWVYLRDGSRLTELLRYELGVVLDKEGGQC